MAAFLEDTDSAVVLRHFAAFLQTYLGTKGGLSSHNQLSWPADHAEILARIRSFEREHEYACGKCKSAYLAPLYLTYFSTLKPRALLLLIHYLSTYGFSIHADFPYWVVQRERPHDVDRCHLRVVAVAGVVRWHNRDIATGGWATEVHRPNGSTTLIPGLPSNVAPGQSLTSVVQQPSQIRTILWQMRELQLRFAQYLEAEQWHARIKDFLLTPSVSWQDFLAAAQIEVEKAEDAARDRFAQHLGAMAPAERLRALVGEYKPPDWFPSALYQIDDSTLVALPDDLVDHLLGRLRQYEGATWTSLAERLVREAKRRVAGLDPVGRLQQVRTISTDLLSLLYSGLDALGRDVFSTASEAELSDIARRFCKAADGLPAELRDATEAEQIRRFRLTFRRLSVERQIVDLVADRERALDWFPTDITTVDAGRLESLDHATLNTLIDRLQVATNGPWVAFRDRLQRLRRLRRESRLAARQQWVAELMSLPPVERLQSIAVDASRPLDQHPVACAKVDLKVLLDLSPPELQALLARLAVRRSGPWRTLADRIRELSPPATA